MTEEQVRPKWAWLPGAKRYYSYETHRFVSFKQVDEWAQETLKVSTEATTTLAGMVADQRLNVADWQRSMKDVIKTEYIAKYLAGRGGVEAMTQADWGRIGGMLKEQYRHLRGFAQAISDGGLSEAQIMARAAMYVRSGRESFERAFATALGAPSLPSYPGDGSTECLCIVSGESRVLTSTGWVPIVNVRPGDMALTHRGRWRRVLATIRKPSQLYHRLAQIRAPTGAWVAATDNHRWYTPQGWRSATDIDSSGIPWYHVLIPLLKGVGHDKILSTVWGAVIQPEQTGSVQAMPVGMSLWGQKGLSGTGMQKLLQSPHGASAMASYASQDGSVSPSSACEAAVDLCGHIRRRLLVADPKHWPALDMVLEGQGQQETHNLPLPVDLGAGQWSNSRRVCNSSPGWGLHQRCVGKSDPYAAGQAQLDTFPRGSKRLAAQESADSTDLREVRQDFLQEAPQEPAQSVLLFGLLPCGSTLYDLVIEDDHSFVIEGLIAHNSNCRCRWIIREYKDRWECTWALDPLGHETCPDCVDRAGDWAPLIIYKLGYEGVKSLGNGYGEVIREYSIRVFH